MAESHVRMSLSDDPYKKGRDSFAGSVRETANFG